MPVLTHLERDQPLIVGVFRNPNDGQEMEVTMLITLTRFWEIALGSDIPEAPLVVPAGWVYVGMSLRERFVGKTGLRLDDNEIGDMACWSSKPGVRAAEKFMAKVVEPGDTPVMIEVAGADYTRDIEGKITTTQPVESSSVNKAGRIPSYQIVDGVATKVGER